MITLGLTGSIAMGKSTVSRMFVEAGWPVFDSDAAVHEFYRSEGAKRVEAAFPGVLVDGAIDRQRLSAQVLGNDEAIRRLEAIVHPEVGLRARRLSRTRRNRAPAGRRVRRAAAVRDRRRARLPGRRGRLRERGKPAGAGLGAPRHDGRKIRGDPEAADARRRKASARPLRDRHRSDARTRHAGRCGI